MNKIKNGTLGILVAISLVNFSAAIICATLAVFGLVDSPLGFIAAGVVNALLGVTFAGVFDLALIVQGKLHRRGERAEFLKYTVGSVGVVLGLIGLGLAISCIWIGGDVQMVSATSLMAAGPVAFAIGLSLDLKDWICDRVRNIRNCVGGFSRCLKF